MIPPIGKSGLEIVQASTTSLGQCVEKKWRRLDGTNHLAEVIRGVKFVDGLKKTDEEQVQEQAA